MGEKGRVIGIDHIHDLVDMSIANVKKDKPDLLKSQRVKLFGKLNFLNMLYGEVTELWTVGDGRKGYPEEGPFDAIHVGAAAPSLPYEVYPFSNDSYRHLKCYFFRLISW